MIHARPTDEIRERASLHALGALDAEESHTFEAHLAECRVCRVEVDGYAAVTGTLGLAAAPVPPSPDLRAKVLAAASRPALPPMLFLTGDDGWREIFPGVLRRDLAEDPVSPAYLIRIAPGASVPLHPHGTIEHCYVLSGEVGIVGHTLRAGDYHRAARGTVHERVSSETGCTLLLIESRA